VGLGADLYLGAVTWWDDFWNWAETSQLGSNVVGGLIVALVVALVALVASVVKKSWRDKIWGHVGKLLFWIRTLRITTTDRIEKEYERRVDEGTSGHEREVEETVRANVVNLGMDARAMATESPSRPRPQPRWKVEWNGFGDEHGQPYILRNLVDRSAAYEVRLDADESRFEFLDGAHWADLSGVSGGQFMGKMKYWIQPNGVTLRVSWLDEENLAHSRNLKLGPERNLEPGEMDPEAPF